MPCLAAEDSKPSTVLCSIQTLKRHTYRTLKRSLSLLSLCTGLLCPHLREGSHIHARSVRNIIWPWEVARRFGPGSSDPTVCFCDPTGKPPNSSTGLGQGWPGKLCKEVAGSVLFPDGSSPCRKVSVLARKLRPCSLLPASIPEPDLEVKSPCLGSVLCGLGSCVWLPPTHPVYQQLHLPSSIQNSQRSP